MPKGCPAGVGDALRPGGTLQGRATAWHGRTKVSRRGVGHAAASAKPTAAANVATSAIPVVGFRPQPPRPAASWRRSPEVLRVDGRQSSRSRTVSRLSGPNAFCTASPGTF